ncbi:MAG: 2-amino-4-hydroxy-6-hydroxymethyldihydropteridine diphosphokinase [Porphyromonas sp.]|jgi:2-amino-4-hydroxy-6-hydroxymethyldihydropteridine diphosphokinase|nr:MAG: 2-amino-4-hydroxy-6-hydroxymethyldihydropteridine diphosphokinase [Porphyromonas sp.]
MPTTYLSLGSNLGDRRQLLHTAINEIAERVGRVEAISSCIETEPVGFDSVHLFLNMAVRVTTELNPYELLKVLKQLERDLGRTRKSHDGVHYDRTIDIDILLYDNLEVNSEELQIPHPRMWERDFVMRPLKEILI